MFQNFSKFHLQIKNDKKDYFIKDAIHGEINFDKKDLWIYKLVNTPEIQRLAKILQLNLSFNNFPTATHNRLSHSLGTYQVCLNFIKSLISRKILKLDEKTQIEINVALAAALLHDIGHGPHSHAFEFYLNFNHEFNGEKIITSNKTAVHKILVEKAKKDKIDPLYYVNSISNIINKKNTDPNLTWVQDLISSQVDCDRLDYLIRDSYFSGLSYGKQLDINLLNKWCLIIKKNNLLHNSELEKQKFINKIAFDKKATLLIFHFLLARYEMYIDLYGNIYSFVYENIIGLMLKRFRYLEEKNLNQKLNVKYKFLYELIYPFFQKNKYFDYKSFIKLTDETFNLVLSTFCESDDPELSSLANLYQGYNDQTDYLIQKITQKEINEIKKLDPNCVLHIVEFLENKIYKKQNPILIYDNDNQQIVEYEKYLKETGLTIKKIDKITKKYEKKFVILKKDTWNLFNKKNKDK